MMPCLRGDYTLVLPWVLLWVLLCSHVTVY
jgi:hypothetical protein